MSHRPHTLINALASVLVTFIAVGLVVMTGRIILYLLGLN